MCIVFELKVSMEFVFTQSYWSSIHTYGQSNILCGIQGVCVCVDKGGGLRINTVWEVYMGWLSRVTDTITNDVAKL